MKKNYITPLMLQYLTECCNVVCTSPGAETETYENGTWEGENSWS